MIVVLMVLVTRLDGNGAVLVDLDGSHVSYMYSKEGAYVLVVSCPFLQAMRLQESSLSVVECWMFFDG